MKPIRLHRNVIDIPFEDDNGDVVETLFFDKTDENLKKLIAANKEIQEEAKEREESEDGDIDVEEAINILRGIWDRTLGDGAFDKIYALNPSVNIMTDYYLEISSQLIQQLLRERSKSAANKYLNPAG